MALLGQELPKSVHVACFTNPCLLLVPAGYFVVEVCSQVCTGLHVNGFLNSDEALKALQYVASLNGWNSKAKEVHQHAISTLTKLRANAAVTAVEVDAACPAAIVQKEGI